MNNGIVINPRSVKTDPHIRLNISAMDKAEYDDSLSHLMDSSDMRELIDVDGYGLLSFDEILNLCKQSLQTIKELDDDDHDDPFYNELADCFAGDFVKF